MWWRAPEVLFGSEAFDASIDLWSFGCVLAELAGHVFMDSGDEHRKEVFGYANAVFRQLGTPACPVLTGLPDWPRKVPEHARRPWPAVVHERLGVGGVGLMEACLSYEPAARPTAEQLLRNGFLRPERFARRPSGSEGTCFQGARHSWNLCEGALAVEVLHWLRGDPALVPGSEEFRALAVSFTAQREDAKSEEGRKFIMAGAMEGCSSTSMCALSLASLLPLPRLRAWRAAFLAVNQAAFEAMQASAHAAIQRLGHETRGKNGENFLEQNFGQRFASCAELVFVEPGNADEGFWAEPEHQDGGGSVMHMGITLYGRRGLVCRQGSDLPDVFVSNVPGTVYLGQLTGPRHQVTHEATLPGELLEVPGLGSCGVSVMLRTALFPHNRARLRNTTPSPLPVFEALARCFRDGLAARPLRLPSLAECKAQLGA